MSKQLLSRMGDLWCSLTHDSVLWPVHGQYECRNCGRRYPAFQEGPLSRRAAFKPAVSLLLLLAFATSARLGHAAGLPALDASVRAEAALERYKAVAGADTWAIESVEINASLPKLRQTGQLRAIRRVRSTGGTGYEVVQLTGDRTVERQVIVRYLKAEEQASELPANSVAITPANYKFTYKGTVDDGERVPCYVFQITPRRKRQGLIKGELWLDQSTGAVVLQSGRLVKSPSVFVKRVSVTRENALRDGAVECRLTHLTIDTRLVGRAELVIEERPLSPADAAQVAVSDTEGGQQ